MTNGTPHLTPADQNTVAFAEGLPGFEAHREFVLMTSPALEPFACLRGLGPDAPSFLAIDPRRIVADYPCHLSDANQARLRASTGAPLVWLALVRPGEAGASVNLRAPVVINPRTMCGLQVVDADDSYPLDLPIAGA
jgi:flagellar assembly factor FliW